MAEEPKRQEQDHSLASGGCADRTRDRERTMRMLQRIADVLGRPVEDFLKVNTDGVASEITAGTVEAK